jgi:hypothetical protein
MLGAVPPRSEGEREGCTENAATEDEDSILGVNERLSESPAGCHRDSHHKNEHENSHRNSFKTRGERYSPLRLV